LKSIEAACRKTPVNQPTLSAVLEALLLREQCTELLRKPKVAQGAEHFRAKFREAEKLCQELEIAVSQSATSAELSEKIAAIAKNCQSWH
jgi:hypothetical protein